MCCRSLAFKVGDAIKRLYARHGPQLRRLQPRTRTMPATRPSSHAPPTTGGLRSNRAEHQLSSTREHCPWRHQFSVLSQPWYLQRIRKLPPHKNPVMLMRKHSRWVQQERAKSKVRPFKQISGIPWVGKLYLDHLQVADKSEWGVGLCQTKLWIRVTGSGALSNKLAFYG